MIDVLHDRKRLIMSGNKKDEVIRDIQSWHRKDMNAYRQAMKGVYTTSVNPSTLDEAPMAYKSLEDIIDIIRETVTVIDVMKPVYNFKASD